MKRLIIFVVLLCVLATSVLAATVAIQYSGIAPGSNYHIFMYDPSDPGPTVVDNVLPNDLISINYPNPKDSHNTLTLTYLFKNQVDNWWDYTVFQEYNDTIINISQRVPIDLYGDGNVELYMEFTNLTNMRYGTFTFYNVNAPATPMNESNATAPANTTQPVENTTPATNATNGTVGGDRDAHGCIPSAGYSWCEAKQKCLRPLEEQCPAAAPTENTSNVTVPAAPPAEQGEFPWTLVILLVIVLGGVAAYLYFMRDQEGDEDEKSKKGKKDEE